jgi:energy-coupling factor transporter ATP-binding protein EcfA2
METTTKNEIIEFARKIYKETNLNIFPCVNKVPVIKWGQFQNTRPTSWSFLENLFQKHRNAGVGLICGFDNVVALDFDAKYKGDYHAVTPLSDLAKKIVALEGGAITPALMNLINVLDVFAEFGINPYVERTPSGGFHIVFRTQTTPPQKQVLAFFPNQKAAIEMQGGGSFVVVAPTPGYVRLNGELNALPILKDEVFRQILDFCKELNASKSKTYIATDIFEKVLLAAQEWGFQVTGRKEIGIYIRRPGTEKLSSATIFRDSAKVFIFTTNAPPFQPNTTYTPVDFVAIAKFNGDTNKAREWLEIPPEEGKRGRKVNFFQEAKDFLLSLGNFRRNLVKGVVEMALHNDDIWRPIGDFEFSELFVQARERGISISKENFREVVKALAKNNPFNPFEIFFNSLTYDDKDYIKYFASRIITEPDVQEKVYSLLKAFFISATAQALGTRGYDLMLVLIGPQGSGKTTLLRHLVPEALKEYYNEITGFTASKDVLKASATSFIVNIDDIDSLDSKEIVFLKSLISKDFVDYRDFYARDWERRWRYASLCGSGNNRNLFFDPSGYRRFIVLPVTQIDKGLFDLNIEKLWAQAYSIFKEEGVDTLNDDLVDTLNNINLRFENLPPEFEMVTSVFQYPIDDSKTLVWNATRVAEFLHSIFPKQMISPKRLSTALMKAGFRSKHTREGNFYFLQVKKEFEDNVFTNFRVGVNGASFR